MPTPGRAGRNWKFSSRRCWPKRPASRPPPSVGDARRAARAVQHAHAFAGFELLGRRLDDGERAAGIELDRDLVTLLAGGRLFDGRAGDAAADRTENAAHPAAA